MTLNISHNSMDDVDFHQRLLTANNLALAHILRGAPLAQTLACIVNGIEDQDPELSGAILLLDEDGHQLRLGAASSLPPHYIRAIDGIASDLEAWTRQAAAGNIVHIPAEKIEASRFWHRFRELALEHGLHVSSMVPIRSATHCVLGIFVAYSREPDRAGDKHRQAMADAAMLASIAIERDADKARILKTENTLRECETKMTRMALAIEGSATGIWDRNISTGEIHYSPGWKANLGYADSEVSNRIEDSYARVHPDDIAYVQATIQAHFDRKTESYMVEHRIRCKDGSYKWISSRGKVVSRDADGKPLRMIGTTTDISAMRTLSDRLQQSVDLITCLTNEIPGLVFQYKLSPDGAAFFTYVSDGIRDIYEVTPVQAAENAALIHERIHADDLAGYTASLDSSAAGLTPWRFEYRVILPRQGLCWRHVDAQPRRLQDGSTLWHGFITDVTERKRMDIELQEFATIDFLTQLPNRRCFMAGVDEELARMRRVPGTHAAVLMCDLDHFKKINDSYGHAIGDLVLKRFASILRDELRENDTVGRMGGEEFAVVLSGAGAAEARMFAERVQKKMAETSLVECDDTASVTVSIGIAVMNATDASVDASLSRSDMALYRAKESGRNRIEIAAD